MKFIELKQDLSANVRNIYLLEGEDAYFRQSAEAQIKAKYLTVAELNYSAYDGTAYKGANYTEITSALSAFPFMAEYRVVKISEFYPTESDYEKYFKQLFENFPATTVLIICNSQSKKGADLKRKKCVAYFDCGKADRDTVAKWAYLTMKRASVSSTVEACEAIADYCLCDMARVSREVQKLIEWGKEGMITRSDVDELVYKDADYRIYQMTGAVARRDYDSFAQICRELTLKGLDENAVIASLLNYFKNLYTALSWEKDESQLAAALKMTDYVLGKTKQQARALGKEKLASYITSLYSLSSRLKSGEITADGALDETISIIFFLNKSFSPCQR